METLSRSISVFILVIMFVHLSKADYCEDNFTLSEFPKGILKEFVSVITTGLVGTFLGCNEGISINDSYVRLLLYTQANRNNPILLDQDNPHQLNTSKPIKVLLPGWLCNMTNDRMPELKDAYLNKFDYNILGVDWTKYSIDLYANSFCYVPLVSRVVGRFLCYLSNKLDVDMNSIHVLGHSMGGQMTGIVGQEVQKQCMKKVGRITSLDPAGPIYQQAPKDMRLDADDAAFVDVVHTNQGYMGYYGNCGTKDFYVNCGTYQRGCMKINMTTPIASIIDLPNSMAACSHIRAMDYLIESINFAESEFIGRSCSTCPGLPGLNMCLPDIIFPTYATMGEDTHIDSQFSMYYVPTYATAPFAKG